MSVIIRQAVEADQSAIRALVYAAHLMPLNLRWPNFVVAEDRGDIVGVGQIRPHRDGSRELASIAVSPAYQGQGIGGEIVRALVEHAPGDLYLVCMSELEPFYARFGFVRAGQAELPPFLGKIHRLGRFFAPVARLFSDSPRQLIAMKRAG
jgi:N-acetylglutamate synthase-like GNAT family acetyltransferase